MLKMTHAIYLVSDAKVARSFLEDAIGLHLTADELTVSGERFLTMSSKSFGVELQVIEVDKHAEIEAVKKNAGVVDFILQTDDIFNFVDHVKSLGLKIFRKPIKTNYGITAIFEDPFGNLWDVVQRTDF